MMDKSAIEQHLEKLCVRHGMRMTEQRRIIAKILTESKDHPDAEGIFNRAKAIDHKISVSTVYRTIRLLEQEGILNRLDFRDGRSRYEEITDDHHDHLICIKTGKVIEFHDAELEALKHKIAQRLGFDMIDHRLEIFGTPLYKKT
ncbi:MAG: Fur family ferric uptake transcriptional regulator [Alphaproteobacteria bacterium]|jgi:Fur family ferric uptake transcriptional regulator